MEIRLREALGLDAVRAALAMMLPAAASGTARMVGNRDVAASSAGAGGKGAAPHTRLRRGLDPDSSASACLLRQQPPFGLLLYVLLITIRKRKIDCSAHDLCAHFDRGRHHGNGGIGNRDDRAAFKRRHQRSHEHQGAETCQLSRCR